MQEIEFERDVFLGEVGRLKVQIQKLKVNHNELMAQNRELQPYADKAADAEAENDRLELQKEVSVLTPLFIALSFSSKLQVSRRNISS